MFAAFSPETGEQVSPSFATLAEALAWRAGRGAHHLDVLPVTPARKD